ncbi:MAG: hypothetical protein OXC08_16035 [Thiotrichales bacterium]|nr:hypothetical protein [Thiotrichales bacterium]
MNPPTSRPRGQLHLNLQPSAPVAPHSAALVRALAELLLEALERDTAMVNAKEATNELEDHA